MAFWLAHIYAAVIASRATKPAPKLTESIRLGARHSAGMLLATLVPAALLALGTFDVIDEYTAYVLALSSGVVMLALIGWANAAAQRESVAVARPRGGRDDDARAHRDRPQHPRPLTHALAGSRNPGSPGMVKTFDELFAELTAKAAERPEGSGTVAQLDAGVHAIGKKIVEEAAEVWMAAEYESDEAAAEEISQLLYHLQVMMLAKGLTPRRRLPTSLSARPRRSTPRLRKPRLMLRIAVPNKGSLAETAADMLARGRIHRPPRPEGPPRHRPA